MDKGYIVFLDDYLSRGFVIEKAIVLGRNTDDQVLIIKLYNNNTSDKISLTTCPPKEVRFVVDYIIRNYPNVPIEK